MPRKPSTPSRTPKGGGLVDPASWPEAWDSMESCSAMTGIPVGTLQLYKRNGCTAFRGGRIHKDDLLAFDAAQGELNLELDVKAINRKIAWQKYEREKWKFAIEKGEYTHNRVFSDALTALGSDIKMLLRQKLENEYPGLLPGLEPEQRAAAKKMGRELVDSICVLMQKLGDKHLP